MTFKSVALQFESTAKDAGARGVISPSTEFGSAVGVGVQLLDSDRRPIEFGRQTVLGKAPNATFDLTYYARYYQTGPSLTAGTVKATATLTFSYL